MKAFHKRNPLVSWYLGLVVIVASVAAVGMEMYTSGCEAPGIAIVIYLLAIPGIYLTLMYLTLKSQP
jgi:hypothetical protein